MIAESEFPEEDERYAFAAAVLAKLDALPRTEEV
jgi:hypothetical protein